MSAFSATPSHIGPDNWVHLATISRTKYKYINTTAAINRIIIENDNLTLWMVNINKKTAKRESNSHTIQDFW